MGACSSCTEPRVKDKSHAILNDFESSVRRVTMEEGRKCINRAMAGGLTRSQLFMVWSEDIGRGKEATPAQIQKMLKNIAHSYLELVKESIEVAITFYKASERAKLLPEKIVTQIHSDFEPGWNKMESIHSKMSESESSKLVARQMEQLKLAPSQQLDFERFQQSYTDELGPAFALTLIARTDMVPNFIELIQRKYQPLF